MATYTLTGDLGNLVGGNLVSPNGHNARAYLAPTAPVVISGVEVRLGATELTLATSGTFTQTGIPEGTYVVYVDFWDPVAHQVLHHVPVTGEFTLDDDLDLGVIVGGLLGWPAAIDATAAALRPTSKPLATLTVNPAASPSSTNYTTIAAACTQATTLQNAAIQQTSLAAGEFSVYGSPQGPDYRVDIIISAGTYNETFGTGSWVALIGATGNPADVVITTSSNANDGTLHSFGPIYLEGLTLQSTGSGGPATGTKYPWHITNSARGCSIAVNVRLTELNTGGQGAIGMDGGEATTLLLYKCAITGISSGAVSNLHGASGNTLPVTTIIASCTMNGNIGYSELGSATDEFWFIGNTGGSVGTLTGSVNSHTTGTPPYPTKLLSALDVAYFRPGIQVGDVQTFGDSDQAAFSPPSSRIYYVHVIPDRAIHRTHAGIVAASAGGVFGVRMARDTIPPSSGSPGFNNTGTLVVGANDALHSYFDTFYPGETGHVWVKCGVVSGTPSVMGSLVMGNAAGSYYSDDGGTTRTLVPVGTRVPVVRLVSQT